jgi:ATP-dependent DNA helicase PIF1
LLYLPVGLADPVKMKELNTKRLLALETRFENVGVLFIDEKSMMGQRQFHMVDMRLQQARPMHKGTAFGGFSVILLGDWKQLPPVCDSSLYRGETKYPPGYNLYHQFKEVIIFDKIQRLEGNDQKEFRQDLDWLGRGEFTKLDWRKWMTRSLVNLHPEEREEFVKHATLACAYKKDMVQRNVTRVKAIGQPVAPISADSKPNQACGERGDSDSGLPSKLILCRTAKFRLTANLWTAAGLTNGATGYVKYILYKPGRKPPALPDAIIATFKGFLGRSYLDELPCSVPIVPVIRQWMQKKVSSSQRQLPIILGYALSIHKLQGPGVNL